MDIKKLEKALRILYVVFIIMLLTVLVETIYLAQTMGLLGGR